MNFCCERFEIHYSFPRSHGLNIRVVKYSESELLDKFNLFRFYITNGYQVDETNIPNLNIAFCPFCGTNLFNYYKSDEYINEVPGRF